MEREHKLALILGLGILIFGGAAKVVQYTQRGLRNNNPGNIRHGEPWDGLSVTQDDPHFATFISPEYGIRAMAKVLTNYQQLYGLNTVRQWISRWAPPGENDTAAYVAAVAGRLGVSPDAPISVKGALPVLIPAIIQHENGLNPYTSSTILAGIRMAA